MSARVIAGYWNQDARRWMVKAAEFLLGGLILLSATVMVPGAEPAAVSVARGQTYRNPVLADVVAADPDVILVDGTYYLYPTTDGQGYDAWTSTDLVNWKLRGSVFRAPRGGAWAPDVFHNKRGDRKFYLYYTVSGPDAPPRGPFGKQVGVAVSDSRLGRSSIRMCWPRGRSTRICFRTMTAGAICITCRSREASRFWPSGWRTRSRSMAKRSKCCGRASRGRW